MISYYLQGHILWDLQVVWELSCLKATKPDSPARYAKLLVATILVVTSEYHFHREALKDHIKALHIERLGQIHSSAYVAIKTFGMAELSLQHMSRLSSPTHPSSANTMMQASTNRTWFSLPKRVQGQ